MSDPSDERRIAELEAANRQLAYKAEMLERQMRRLDKMAEANELLNRNLYEDLSAASRTASDRSSELAQANAELRLARAAAEQANSAKSEFLANMSHELRTPLNAIIGYAEMLAEDLAEEGADDLVDDLGKIRAAGKHLLALINGVLDISKIEAGKMSLYLETFDVAMLVGEVEQMILPLIRQNQNDLIVRIAPDTGEMHADLTKVRQTLFNLLSNSAKFTERGTITLDVVRTSQREDATAAGGEVIEFRVSDTGIGMADDQLETIFEPFTQADSSTSRKYGGTGLGLAISQSFCRLMGGEIRVSSRVGAGSVFVATIPVRVQSPSNTQP